MIGLMRMQRSRLPKQRLSSPRIIAAVLALVFCALLNASFCQAQSQATDVSATPGYEVASIKPNKSGNNTVMVRSTSDRFSATGVTVRMLIENAYGVHDFQIQGAPEWLSSEKYDIEAKMDSAVAEQLQKLDRDQRQETTKKMMQALLADRFQLKIHNDSKEMSVYALVVAKSGLKMQAAKADDTYPNGFKGPDGHGGAGMMFMEGNGGPVIGQGVPVSNLVRMLATQLGRTVVDKTGLTGNYDFTLKWAPDPGSPMFKGPGVPPAAADAPAPDAGGPSLFTALQEQLGLKLESQKAPVEILVIDHVERPSEN
jgi:uncharacterized protein (TIGR03435 family)